MAPSGHKPKPTAIKRLEGNRSKKPLPVNEPKPDLGNEEPGPPEWLSEVAKAEWRRLARQLWLNGLLGREDVQAFAAYCDHFANAMRYRGILDQQRIDEARVLRAQATWDAFAGAKGERPEPETAAHASMIRTTNGNWVQNPIVGMANVSTREMMKIATEFGLTPSSRSRIDVPRGGANLPAPRDAEPTGPRPIDFLNRGPRLVASKP